MIYDEDRFNEWLPANYDGRFDWDFLLPAFEGTKIRPMDVDAIIHKDGPHGDQFLLFETKAPGAEIPIGQAITLAALLREGNKLLFYIQGKTPYDMTSLTIYARNLRDGWLVSPVEPQYVLAQTRRWMRWAIGGFAGEDPFCLDYDNQVIAEHREHTRKLHDPAPIPALANGR